MRKSRRRCTEKIVSGSAKKALPCGVPATDSVQRLRYTPSDPRGALMLAKLNTFALVGIDAVPVVAEVDASVGLPKTVLVGLPEAAVRESVHRIERALVNLGYRRHPGRTVINLAPASLPHERLRGP
jgi:magnesium chelatase family protein